MADYRQVRTLSREEAAYIAGIIDGEGTITLTHIHRNANRQLVVSISSTERELLNFILRTVGAGRITNKRIARAHHTPSAAYAVNNRQALSLLEQVTPFLRTYKARRAQFALANYVQVTPRNGKYTDIHRSGKIARTLWKLRRLGEHRSIHLTYFANANAVTTEEAVMRS